MTFHRLKTISKNQKGFSLIELLIVIAITGMIIGGIAMTIFQTSDVNARSVAHMAAIKEVENATHWITRDAQVAQTVNATAPSGFPLALSWVEWNSTSHNVTYSVQNGQLQRSHCVNGGQPTEIIVVQHVNSDSQMTNCQFSSSVLSVKISVSIVGFRSATETRSFSIVPRPGQ